MTNLPNCHSYDYTQTQTEPELFGMHILTVTFLCAQDLKKPIIDHGLSDIVNTVIIPHSGWDRNMDEETLRRPPRDVYWPTVFRNASGVLRYVSGIKLVHSLICMTPVKLTTCYIILCSLRALLQLCDS